MGLFDMFTPRQQSLQRELQSDDLIQEEKDRIENKMLEVAKLIGEKDSANKRFLVTLVQKNQIDE